jgi:hypothetical protein
MSRPTRSFKLRLSPTGMDLLIDAHCHLIRATRRLLAWGTTLHVAIVHLETVPGDHLADQLRVVRAAGLAGGEEHHVGGPNSLVGLASSIAARIAAKSPQAEPPSLGAIYLLALHILVRSDAHALRASYDRSKSASR